MEIPDLPPPDQKGRIVLRLPASSRPGLVFLPLVTAMALACLLILPSFRQTFGIILVCVLAVPFVILSGFFLFSPYQVVLDDNAISAGVRGVPNRISWNQIERIQLLGKPPNTVRVTCMVNTGRGSRQQGPFIKAFIPLSTEETALLILRQAQNRGAPVKQIDDAI